MTPEESDRLKWMVWHDTVRRLGARGGLTDAGLEAVRQDLLPDGIWPEGSIPADLEPDRLKLLDEVCQGLARWHRVPDFAPDDNDPRGAGAR